MFHNRLTVRGVNRRPRVKNLGLLLDDDTLCLIIHGGNIITSNAFNLFLRQRKKSSPNECNNGIINVLLSDRKFGSGVRNFGKNTLQDAF